MHQVISIRSASGGLSTQYYVHYVDYNKRLDEWVTEERLDTRRITPPAKDEKDGKAGGGAGTAATPKQRQPTVSASLSVSAVPSRPSSPSSVDADPAVPSGTSVLQAALQKKQGPYSIEILLDWGFD